jgi:hypothetical protein
MIVNCPQCQSKYDAKAKDEGRRVTCQKCGTNSIVKRGEDDAPVLVQEESPPTTRKDPWRALDTWRRVIWGGCLGGCFVEGLRLWSLLGSRDLSAIQEGAIGAIGAFRMLFFFVLAFAADRLVTAFYGRNPSST